MSFSPLLTRRLIAGGLFIASFSLYLSTLAPSVVTIFDDSLEFQLVTYQLGIAHPTGYPLYTLLGKLFTFLPIGDIAYRVNLMSAFFGAATVALLYLLILQIAIPTKGVQVEAWTPHGSTYLGGVIGALLLAVSPVFWQQATIAEVYTLNAFFVVALLLLTITLKKEGGGGLWLTFIAGLALTHHRTIMLLFPALGLYLYLNQKRGFWKQVGFFKTLILGTLIGLAPLLIYLYLPLRGHVGSLDGTYANTWAGFWRQVSASGYSLFVFDNPFGQEHDAAFYWNLFQGQFYTLVPGLIGLLYLAWQGQRKVLILTGSAFLTYLAFNLFYNVSDIQVFFIPSFLLWAAWSGVGLAFLLQLVSGVTTDRRPQTAHHHSTLHFQHFGPAPAIVLVVIFAFFIFKLFQTNLPILAARNSWQVHDYGLDMLQQPLPEDAAIVGILGEITLLRYFQQTENRRPDLETVAADAEAERLAAVENLLAKGKAVYLTRELPGAPERWSLSAVGPLIRVNPEPLTTPPPVEVAVKQVLTPEISLLGYNIARPAHTGRGPAPLRLTLFWQAAASLTANLKVSARLLNPAGEAIATADAIPVHFAYPTMAWRPGEVVADVYDLVLPVDAPPGPYIPLLIWYDPAQNAAEVGRIELGPVNIE